MMAEPDTAALVETIQAALGPGGVWTSDSHAALAALDALAQRLADAEYRRTAESMDRIAAEARATRAEEALREVVQSAAGCEDYDVWLSVVDKARAALTPTEEPEHGA